MKKILLYFFSHRTLALLRWDLYFLRVRLSNLLLFKKRSLLKRLGTSTHHKYLNLGSGPRGKESSEWINIDGFPDTNVHYLCDFNKPLPFKEDTFDGIFCEHVLEHFDYQNGKKLMVECHRVLKKGGIVRIIVPNGNKFLKAYFEQPEFIAKYKEAQTGFAMEAVNNWFYQRYEHQCIYDANYLADMLKRVGFTEAREAAFDTAAFENRDIVIDDSKYAWESLYMEAIK